MNKHSGSRLLADYKSIKLASGPKASRDLREQLWDSQPNYRKHVKLNKRASSENDRLNFRDGHYDLVSHRYLLDKASQGHNVAISILRMRGVK